MDAIDRQLLTIIQKDCSATVNELAEQVPLTASAISRRLARLKHSGIVAAEVAILSRKVRESRLTALLSIELDRHHPDQLEQMKRTFQDSEFISMCLEITGDSDILVMLSVRDMEEFNAFVEELAAMKIVRRYRTTFVKRHLKFSLALPVD